MLCITELALLTMIVEGLTNLLCTKVRVLSLFVRISNHVDWRCSLSYPASTAGLASAPFSAPVPRGIAATTAQVRSGR